MTDFNNLVNDTHARHVAERIAYHRAQVACWTRSRETFGKSLPECDGKIAYHLEMIEIERAALAR